VRFLNQWVEARVGRFGESVADSQTRYMTSLVDLNGDGRPEALIYVTGPDWCGTGGCVLLVLKRDGASWQVVNWTPAVRPPIRVLDSKTHGWRDLGIQRAGGGIKAAYEEVRGFNGIKYSAKQSVKPRNAAAMPGVVAIDDHSEGRLLSP